ncbi:hypothetical protein AWR36_012880 [Microbulbifer flavimaris]|uniref:Uncharacterized protein n=2 Tax=Pseudomonadota TaxID=1224 RepID=A0ABX4HXL7_9GAMM|nr:hypothetical protein AVO43_12850 [Microbulbifer sp. ZGT114]PCO04880.1 hypothetical protein AWR36_012880 [Microbulbifer flavimaris]
MLELINNCLHLPSAPARRTDIFLPIHSLIFPATNLLVALFSTLRASARNAVTLDDNPKLINNFIQHICE